MLKKLFTIRNMKVVLAFAVVLSVLGGLYRFVVLYNRQSMTLILNYIGSEKGLNPDGSRFNLYEVTSEAVMQAAIDKMENTLLTLDKVRDRVDIDTKMPSNVLDRVTGAINEGNSYKYIPSEFVISYSQKNKFQRNEVADFLTALSEAYTEHFYENYTEKDTVLIFEPLDLSRYDYLELVDVFSDKIGSMMSYLSKHQSENDAFRSSTTGETFGNVIEMLRNLNDIELSRFNAYVTISAVSTDNDSYVNKLTYIYDTREKNYEKLSTAKTITEEAMNIYNPNITGVVFIPTVDMNKDFYMNKTKTGLDYLADDAYERGVKAAEIKKGMDKFAYLIDRFVTYRPAMKTPEAQAYELSVADAMVVDINSRLNEISQIARETDADYVEYKTKNYLNFKLPEKSTISAIKISYMIKLFMLGIMLGVVFLLFEMFILPKIKRRVPKISLSGWTSTKGGDE
ncbi:MAG: hypothetical protein Q4C12_03940 [Clostridia bacterium]|nr:hypothetical protein [Clostridia bacterium]